MSEQAFTLYREYFGHIMGEASVKCKDKFSVVPEISTSYCRTSVSVFYEGYLWPRFTMRLMSVALVTKTFYLKESKNRKAPVDLID